MIPLYYNSIVSEISVYKRSTLPQKMKGNNFTEWQQPGSTLHNPRKAFNTCKQWQKLMINKWFRFKTGRNMLQSYSFIFHVQFWLLSSGFWDDYKSFSQLKAIMHHRWDSGCQTTKEWGYHHPFRIYLN